jgi:hypothetical protein
MEILGRFLPVRFASPTRARAAAASKRIVGDRHTIVDGPFTEAKEIVAGFWLLQVKSREEMVAWAMRCPAPVEVRQVFDFADFPAELQEAAASETELRAQIERQHQS